MLLVDQLAQTVACAAMGALHSLGCYALTCCGIRVVGGEIKPRYAPPAWIGAVVTAVAIVYAMIVARVQSRLGPGIGFPYFLPTVGAALASGLVLLCRGYFVATSGTVKFRAWVCTAGTAFHLVVLAPFLAVAYLFAHLWSGGPS